MRLVFGNKLSLILCGGEIYFAVRHKIMTYELKSKIVCMKL